MIPDAPYGLLRFKVFGPGHAPLYGVILHYPAFKADVALISDYKWCVCGKSKRATAVLPDSDALAPEGLGRIALAIETLHLTGPCPCGTPEWVQ